MMQVTKVWWDGEKLMAEPIDPTTIYQEPAQQEPVAIPQFRVQGSSDWYDGVPDHHDGHGPYEVRTLYTTQPQRTWVGLEAEDRLCAKYMQDAPDGIEAVIDYIEAKLKEKNT